MHGEFAKYVRWTGGVTSPRHSGDPAIGNRLKHLRGRRKVNQEVLGGLIGVSGATVSRYESGILDIGLTQVRLLADALNRDVCDLACRLLKDDDDEERDRQDQVEDIRHDMAAPMLRMQRQAGTPTAETLLDLIRQLLREYDEGHSHEG